MRWNNGNTTSSENSIISDYIPIKNLKELYSNYNFVAFYYDSSKAYLGNGEELSTSSTANGTHTNVPSNSSIFYVRIYWRSSWNNDVDMTSKTDVMLTKNTVPTTYVPYNCIQIKKCNKNFWNNNVIMMDRISFSNGIYSASDNDNRDILRYKVQEYTESGTVIPDPYQTYKNITAKGKYYFTLTKAENAKTLRLANAGQTVEFSVRYPLDDIQVGEQFTLILEVIDTTIGASKFKDVMLVKGAVTELDYIANQEKTYNFPLSEGQVLMEDGTIENKVVNPWKIKIFDGTEDGWYIANTGTANFYYRYRYLDNFKYTATSADFFCNRFSFSNVGGSTTTEGMFITQTGEIRIRFGTEMSLDDFKAWLALNPVELQYRLVTPDETDFTPEQQSVIDEIIRDGTYDEVTYYSSLASINPDIEAVGIKSAKYEIEEIKSAIIALGGNLDV